MRKALFVPLFLAVCLPIAACNINSSGKGGDPGSGNGPHYQEAQIALPTELSSVSFIVPDKNGAPDFYLMNNGPSENGEFLSVYQLENGILEKRATPGWAAELASAGIFVSDICRGPDGYLTVLGSNYNTMRPILYKEDNSGALEEIPLQWIASESERRVSVLSDASVLIAQQGVGLVHYNADGSVRKIYEDYDYYLSTAVLRGGQIAISGKENIRLYDAATGKEAEPIGYARKEAAFRLLSSDGKGALYGYDDSGIYLWDGERWALEIPRDAMLLGNASSPSRMYAAGNQEIFLTDGDTLFHYTATAEAPAVQRELRIFMMFGNEMLTQAAGSLKNKTPGLSVKLEYGSEMGANVSDAIKVVNTELLAGKGADIYVLDDLPVASTIKKGVLLDLSDVASRHEDECLAGMMESYRQTNGAIHVLPAKFSVPLLWGSKDFLSEADSFARLADWAQAQPDPPLFNGMSRRELAARFYSVCVPAWMDDQGRLDQQRAEAFYENIARIADSQADPEEPDRNIGRDFDARFFGFSQAAACEAFTPNDLAEGAHILAKKGGGGVAAMVGQSGNVFFPRLLMAVNARSSHIDDAKAYLDVLFSPDVQRSSDLSLYFPVNKSALDAVVNGPEAREWDLPAYPRKFSYGGMEEEAQIEGAPQEIRDAFLSVCGTLETPAATDARLLELISDAADGFYQGLQTPQMAAQSVVAKAQAYLDE